MIGPRATARKLGIPQGTLTKWASRHNWKVPEVFKPIKDYWQYASRRQGVAIVRETQDVVINEQGADTRLYLSSASLKAAHQAASSDGAELMGKIPSMALLNTARTADVVHGWSAARMQPQVQVAVQVNMPTPEEQAQREADHKRMDELTAQLRALPRLGGGGAGMAEGQ